MSTSNALARNGNYSGNRYLAPDLPALCKTTTIDGSISNGRVNLSLSYNGASLSGRMSKSGPVRLTGGSGNGDGVAYPNKIYNVRIEANYKVIVDSRGKLSDRRREMRSSLAYSCMDMRGMGYSNDHIRKFITKSFVTFPWTA